MSKRVQIWLTFLVLAAPLVCMAFPPDFFGLLVQGAFAYPRDVVWLFVYDSVFAYNVFRFTSTRLRFV